jgi:hydroxyacylglutathione hydrolase
MGYDVALNKGERLVRSEKDILEQNGLDYSSFKKAIATNPDALILDTRENVSKGVPKGAINIGLNSNFSIYTGTIVHYKKSILLIGDCQGTTEQSIIRLLRIGFDNIIGYLKGGIKTWIENGGETTKMTQISAEEFKKYYDNLGEHSAVLDVRNKAEWLGGALSSSNLIPLRDLEEKIIKKDLDHLKNKKIYIHCRTGPRALIGQSILAKYGFHDVTTVIGGYNKMCELGFKLTPRTE